MGEDEKSVGIRAAQMTWNEGKKVKGGKGGVENAFCLLSCAFSQKWDDEITQLVPLRVSHTHALIKKEGKEGEKRGFTTYSWFERLSFSVHMHLFWTFYYLYVKNGACKEKLKDKSKIWSGQFFWNEVHSCFPEWKEEGRKEEERRRLVCRGAPTMNPQLCHQGRKEGKNAFFEYVCGKGGGKKRLLGEERTNEKKGGKIGDGGGRGGGLLVWSNCLCIEWMSSLSSCSIQPPFISPLPNSCCLSIQTAYSSPPSFPKRCTAQLQWR